MSREEMPPLNERLDYGEQREPRFGPISLRLQSRTLEMDGNDEVETLTPVEYQVLWLLVRAQGGVISDTDVMRFTYEDSNQDLPLSNGTAVLIGRIKKKLQLVAGDTVMIETVRGLGYRLVTK